MPVQRESDILTVASVRTVKGQATEFLFYERARPFSLSARAREDRQVTRSLRAALARRRPLKVHLNLLRGEIDRVAEPGPADLERVLRERPLLDRPEKIVPIDVHEIDPTTFDIADVYLKWPPFKLCTKVVPSLAKAKEIFGFCAGLSCHLPGPPAVPPCIPFQYVRDGCYARAHQMRRIILKKWGYCVEKVFSFGNVGNDTLAVQANKWGGCCVTWWYHVVPLLRVQVLLKLPGGTATAKLNIAMVLDPGMFDKPVKLSTWLAAQESTVCHPNAHVSSYSIQPGSAYCPAYGGGFTTDPNYVSTEATLLAYAGLVTC